MILPLLLRGKEIWGADLLRHQTELGSSKRPKVPVKRDVFNLVLKQPRPATLSGHQGSTGGINDKFAPIRERNILLVLSSSVKDTTCPPLVHI